MCEYYGHPPPAGGMSWRLNHEGGEGSTRNALAAVNGLAWERGRNYWAVVQTDAFNQFAPQTGIYTCEALDESGRVLASVPITAQGMTVFIRSVVSFIGTLLNLHFDVQTDILVSEIFLNFVNFKVQPNLLGKS